MLGLGLVEEPEISPPELCANNPARLAKVAGPGFDGSPAPNDRAGWLFCEDIEARPPVAVGKELPAGRLSDRPPRSSAPAGFEAAAGT